MHLSQIYKRNAFITDLPKYTKRGFSQRRPSAAENPRRAARKGAAAVMDFHLVSSSTYSSVFHWNLRDVGSCSAFMPSSSCSSFLLGFLSAPLPLPSALWRYLSLCSCLLFILFLFFLLSLSRFVDW